MGHAQARPHGCPLFWRNPRGFVLSDKGKNKFFTCPSIFAPHNGFMRGWIAGVEPRRKEFTLDRTTINGGLLRRLWPADIAGFRAHLLRLDDESRQARFGTAVSDDFLNGYASRCFGIDDVIYGYIVDGEVRGAGELRGIGHNLPLGFGGSAEAAFSVERDWRRNGVGAELMSRIVRAARNRRADTLYMSCLVNNQAMLRLARKFSAELRFEPEESQGQIAPKAPTPATMFDEAAEAFNGFATAMVDLHRRNTPAH